MPVQSTKVMQYTFISKQIPQKDAFVLIVEVRLPYKGTNFSVNQNAKKTKNRGIILTNGGGKNAQNCINIHSNCIIMQF